jgi:hypothetical protein
MVGRWWKGFGGKKEVNLARTCGGWKGGDYGQMNEKCNVRKMSP